MILRKITLAFCFAALLGLFLPSTPSKAIDSGTTLGIIGTALGGSALGLGLWNRYSIWRANNGAGYGYPAAYGGGYGMPQMYGGYGMGMPAYGGDSYGCGQCYAPQQVTCYRPVVNYVPVTYTMQVPVGCSSSPVGCSPVGCSPVGCSASYGLFR